MDKKAIETISVSAVRDSVVVSDFLDQYIPDNDKEPSWDGFVYIYTDKSKTKSKLKGRLPVQIKGTVNENFSKDEISFPVSVVDLNNYLYDGGVVFFVVYIGKNGLTKQIYYSELPPIKLRMYLADAKGKKSKNIKLKKFPINPNEKAMIFFQCLENCQKQASFSSAQLLSLDELEKQGVLEGITVPVSTVGGIDPNIALLKNEVYIYANIKGSAIPQPLDVIPKDIHTQQVEDALITIDDRIFYTNCRVVKSAKEMVICLGESFKIIFNEFNQYPCKIKYNNSNKIRVLAKDLDFMLTYLEKGYFKFNNIEIPINYEEMDSSKFNIEKEREHLSYAQDIVRVFDILGCSEDIDVNDMVEEDWRNLNRLITAFLEKKPVNGLKEDLPSLISLKIGKLRFLICLKKCKEKGTYMMYDFFKTDISCAFEDENNPGIMLPISQYSILHENDFLTFSNVNFDILLPSFQKTDHNYETFNRANLFLLELLNAFDKAKGTRKEKILKTCKEFSSWIFTASENELDYQIKMLNQLQIIKRCREFNIDEIRTLYAMVENKNTREDCIIGAYLLLEQQQAAELHFGKLSEEEQKIFKEYPIYHFWKTEEN